jgi:tetratricopeptide (TPR) repeat protein
MKTSKGRMFEGLLKLLHPHLMCGRFHGLSACKYERNDAYLRLLQERLMSKCREIDANCLPVAGLRLEIGDYLFANNREKEAIEQYKDALSIFESLCGFRCWQAADTKVRLHNAYFAIGDHNKAERLVQQALKMLLRSGYQMSAIYANALEALAWDLLAQRKLEQALLHHNQALYIVEGLFGSDSPEHVECQSSQAWMFWQTKFYHEAEESWQKVFARSDLTIQIGLEDLAEYYKCYAAVLYALGKDMEATRVLLTAGLMLP